MDRLGIARKLVLMLVIPIAGSLVFSALQTSEKISVVRSMSRLEELSGIAIAASQLAHELQRERGRTVAFLGSAEREGSGELSTQRARTDEVAGSFREAVAGRELDGELRRTCDGALQALSDLGSHRSLVGGRSLGADEADDYYTNVIATLLGLVTSIAESAESPQVALRLVSLDALVRLEELSGQERAMTMGILGTHRRGSEVVRELGSNRGMQDAYEQMFLAHASTDAVRLYRERSSSGAAEDVRRIRDQVIASASRDPLADGLAEGTPAVDVDPEQWWTVSTARIDGLFEVEQGIEGQVREDVNGLRSSAYWALVFFALLALGSTTAAITLAWSTGRSLIRSFQSASETLQAVVAQISAFVKQQASSTSETATSVSQTTTTVEEIRKTAETAEGRSRDMTKIAQSSKTAADDALSAVAHGTQAMQQIRSEVEGIAQNILELSEKNIQIGEIVQSVNAIAEQSNLLAVNASIEAAKAGDHGRGFSVVASEVKALAQQSKQATDQIRTILAEIQKSSNGAVMITEQGVKRVEEGGSLIEELGRTIKNLGTAIDGSADAATQISLISTQQLAGIEQITEAMRNVGVATSQNADGARQLEEASTEIRAVADRILRIVQGGDRGGKPPLPPPPPGHQPRAAHA